MKQAKQKIGLGLSSLKNRIEMIDGTVEIKSAINKGVEFNIVIDNIQKLNVE